MMRTRQEHCGGYRSATAVTILLCFSLSIFGVTLQAYQARIESAARLAFEVEQVLRRDEVDHALFREFVGQVRRDFPSTEPVEWSGSSIEVSNDWLLAKVSEFDLSTDLKKRLSAVVAIREYLFAVAYKMNELQEAEAASRTKNDDKQKLAEILRREEYQKPQEAQETAFQRWLRSIIEWLTSIWPEPATPSQSSPAVGSFASFVSIILYIALAAVLGFLIFKIAPLLLPHLRRRTKPRAKGRVILGEQIAEGVDASDLFSDAERLAREGDLRGAIRKGYVALLCDLSDRRVIGLARHKTNRDYLRDVRSRGELHPRMQSVTEMFERHWYGFARSEENDWVRFSEAYRDAIRSV